MLKIWGRRNSFNVQKVMWLVGELGLEHQHIDAGGSFGGLDRPEFLQMNPHGRVPVVDDDGITVWESHSIIRYLSAKYGPGSFWIDEPVQRSFADRWMDWTLATLQPDFMDLFWGFYRPKNAIGRRSTRWSPDVPDTFGCYRHLAGKCGLAGNRLTMADIPAGTAPYRYFELEIDHPAVPNVTAWYERLQLRTPYRQHVMIPFDDLRGRLQY